MSATADAGRGMVYVVVLNWNGWRDTIPCAESVLRSDYPRVQLLVCDNASTDGSLERLEAWASGAAPAQAPHPGDPLARLFSPPVPKPVRHVVLTREEAERGGSEACDGAPVVLVQTGANLGFAGGCNVGLRYALARGDCAYVWLLNNDTVVEPGALSALVARLAERPEAEQCGARVLYYDAPERVQSWGGARYNAWLAATSRLGDGARAAATPDTAAVEREMDFVYAAAALVRRGFLERVGLMQEDYFLYFEEVDWALRGAPFARAYAHDAVVYHREGRSIGSSTNWREKSALSDFYALRNRLLVTRRFFPRAVPTVYCGLLVALLKRLLRGQFRRAAMVVGILSGRAAPPGTAACAGRAASRAGARARR